MDAAGHGLAMTRQRDRQQEDRRNRKEQCRPPQTGDAVGFEPAQRNSENAPDGAAEQASQLGQEFARHRAVMRPFGLCV